MDDNKNFATAGGLLMLLFSTLLIVSLMGCAEHTRPSDPLWDKQCHRHYSENAKTLEACKQKVEKESKK